MKSKYIIPGLVCLLILILIYTYLHYTVPHLTEHFANENEIKKLKTQLETKTEGGQYQKYMSNLYEYDLEKASANYSKVQKEATTLESYYSNLKQSYDESNATLRKLRENYASDRKDCSVQDTALANLRKELETITKEKKSTEIQVDELKKQLAIKQPTKKDNSVMDAKQSELNKIEAQMAELKSRIAVEGKALDTLRAKLSVDEDRLRHVQKQHDVYELQMIKVNTDSKKDSDAKQLLEAELKEVKQNIANSANEDGDITKLRTKYTNRVKKYSELDGKIKTLTETTTKENTEIKTLESAIAGLQKK